MFVVLTLLNSFDELEGAAINVLAPEIQRTFGISEGTIVFISTASAAFFVLGAVPMGWLADRVQPGADRRCVGPALRLLRVPLRSRVQRVHVVLDAFLHGHRQGEHDPRAPVVDGRQLPDRRARADVGDQQHGRPRPRSREPGTRRRDRDCGPAASRAGAGRGSSSASPCRSSASPRSSSREPPRGQFEKEDVLGEQIADDNPAPISMEAAFARLKRIRTLRTVLVAFCALGFGLFSQGSLASLYLDDTLHVDSRPAARRHPQLERDHRVAPTPPPRAATSTASTARTRPRRSRSSAC